MALDDRGWTYLPIWVFTHGFPTASIGVGTYTKFGPTLLCIPFWTHSVSVSKTPLWQVKGTPTL